MGNLNELREQIYAYDNKACFIERERILMSLEKEYAGYTEKDRYARILSDLLDRLSTPVDAENDYFAGRMVEALPDEGMKAPHRLLLSEGHMSYDYPKLVSVGLRGILADISRRAEEKGDEESHSFSHCAAIVVEAVRRFADRYADAAEAAGREDLARMLRRVPYEPAYDFDSALQGIWLLHMIGSCCVGARDFAFGRFDQYMLPYYEQALAEGRSEEELRETLAGFLIKANEICGRTAHNYAQKPVLSHSSNQYINLGGETPNLFSCAILRAAMLANMPQPHMTVLLKPEADAAFTSAVFEAMSYLTDKLHVYNYEPIKQALMAQGIPGEIAKDFTYSACCTFDLNHHSRRQEYFTPAPQIFLSVLHGGVYSSVEEILSAWQEAMRADLQKMANFFMKGLSAEECRKRYVLDGMMLTDSAMECRYAADGSAPYNMLNFFCPCVATLGDSLMVLDRLVFGEKRYSYEAFIEILRQNYEGNEALRQEILHMTRFGNDSDADRYTVMVGNAYLAAMHDLQLADNFFLSPGFYSLERDNIWRDQVGATPDGRRQGDPMSENQSPTYGADRSGITALLRSISKLPFAGTVTGGLNLTFSQKLSPRVLQSLVLSYFEMGGFHVGMSVVDHTVLRDAMKHPEKYRSLTVRIYGFSEYFICLPPFQQEAVLNRTLYNGG